MPNLFTQKWRQTVSLTLKFNPLVKYAICDPHGTVFNDSVCALTMATMTKQDLTNLNKTEFFDVKLKKLMDERSSYTIIFIGLGIGNTGLYTLT